MYNYSQINEYYLHSAHIGLFFSIEYLCVDLFLTVVLFYLFIYLFCLFVIIVVERDTCRYSQNNKTWGPQPENVKKAVEWTITNIMVRKTTINRGHFCKIKCGLSPATLSGKYTINQGHLSKIKYNFYICRVNLIITVHFYDPSAPIDPVHKFQRPIKLTRTKTAPSLAFSLCFLQINKTK